MSEWKPFVARLSLFASVLPPELASPIELFKLVWNKDPDSYQKAPNPLMPSVAHGQVQDLMMSCVCRSGRIDFEIGPPPPIDLGMEPTLPEIADSQAVRNQIDHLMDLVKNDRFAQASIRRVALFVHFGTRAGDGWAEANGNLMKAIPERYRPTLKDEQEFVLQMNQPIAIQCSGVDLTLNCITKWSIDQYQVLSIVAPPPSERSAPSGQQIASSAVKAVSLAFDVNNVPARALSTGVQYETLQHCLDRVSSGIRECGITVEGF